METRRTRRIHQRNMRRIALVALSVGIVGLAVGLSLPRSATASLLLLVVAAAILAITGLRVAAPTTGPAFERWRDRARASRRSTFARWRMRLTPIGETLFPTAPAAPSAPDPADFWSRHAPDDG
jgi:hypothetical protein